MIDKQVLINYFDSVAPARPAWFKRNFTYHNQIIEACRPFLNPDSRVLEAGCSTGDLLAALNPAHGVGIDLSPRSIEIARANYPQPALEWYCGDIESPPDLAALREPFDIVIMSDLVGYLNDIQQTLADLHRLMHSGSRVVISMWNWMWQPLLAVAERLRFKNVDSGLRQNWLSPSAIQLFLALSGYETVSVLPGVLLPYHVPVLSPIVNTLSYAPLLNRLPLLTTVIARPILDAPAVQHRSVTVVIPTRNEAENIAALVERVPAMGTHTELLFVDGDSTDGTVERIHAEIARHPERDIKFMPQVPPRTAETPPDLMLKLGKGDAVRKGFAAASGEIIMILDSDVSVPPEELVRFYDALVTGKARLANGTRFTYPQELGAMRPLNYWGNVFFTLTFSWLLGQRVSDTLCGTKALYKEDYEVIAANRAYFGDFDPFGDFDLLFGAARLRYRILDVPVHYKARTYGTSKVRVGVHGPLLMRMSVFALWQLKLRPLVQRQPVITERSERDDTNVVPSGTASGWLLLIFSLVLVFWLFFRRRD